MLKLIRCECKKLKRKKLLLFVALAACLFPIPLSMLVIHEDTGADYAFAYVFKLLEVIGTPIMLPIVIGFIAATLFFMERENDTLKSLLIVPIFPAQLAFAKIIVLFIFGVLYALVTAAAAMLGGVIAGGALTNIGQMLWVACITGLCYTAATLPFVILIVLFRRSYLFSMLATVIFGLANYSSVWSGMTLIDTNQVLSAGQRVLLATPGCLILRWQLHYFTDVSPNVEPFVLSIWVLLAIMLAIAVVSYLFISIFFRRWQN